jgi:hypothetical protein
MFVEAARHQWRDKGHATQLGHPPHHTTDVAHLPVHLDSGPRHQLTQPPHAASPYELADEHRM